MENIGGLARGNFLGMISNVTLVSMMLSSILEEKFYPDTTSIVKSSYDYIIVGGGPAGSVMASRLSEKQCVSVLLLEAGGDPPPISEVPGYARIQLRSPDDWLYMTEPQKYGAFAQKEKKVPWNSGKAIGGGSIINAMMYVRGNKENFDQWEAKGATGWSYKDVKPYFLKLEDNRNLDKLDPGYHRRGGPMTAERINYTSVIKEPVLEATADMGYEERDINGERQTGMFNLQAMVRNQRRCSAAKAYLVPVDKRPNLDIVKDAFVRKIIIKNRKAVGVEYDHLLLRKTVSAKKEVIVSAGAVRTPQLLMLSGIGPKEELRKFNISVIADLPGVGRNLMDHYGAPIVYQLSEHIPQVVLELANPINILDYITNRRGVLASPCEVSLLAFLDGLNTTANSRDFPRQELYFAEYNVLDLLVNSQMDEEVYKEVFHPYELKPLYICIVSLLQPQSTGNVTLRSADPRDYPVIDPNYYQNPSDLKDIVEGIKVCNAVAKHPAMQKIGARPLDTVYPACKKFLGDEERYLKCVTEQVIFTIWHPCCTAKMGDPCDRMTVVDPQLRVIGVQGLRVVNAAIMPNITSGNLEIPTLMVAEKAYDMMKDDIKCDGTL